MDKVKTHTVAVIATAVAVSSGCIFQPLPTVEQGAPYARTGAKVRHEHRDASKPDVEATLAANAIDVTLSQPIECRDRTPMVRDVETKRSTNSWEQYMNGGSFLLLGGIGVYELAGPCRITASATSSNPNPPSEPCTSAQKGTANTVGGVLLGLGAMFGAAFVYNVIRAQDSTETVAVHAQRVWTVCGSKPVPDTTVSLFFADGQQLSRDTNSQGHARFDLSSVRWSDESLSPGSATLAVPGTDARGTLSLAGLPAYTAWQERAAQLAQQAVRPQQRSAMRNCIMACIDGCASLSGSRAGCIAEEREQASRGEGCTGTCRGMCQQGSINGPCE